MTAELAERKAKVRGRRRERAARAVRLGEGAAHGAARERRSGRGDDAGRLRVALRVPGLQPAQLHHLRLPGHARLGRRHQRSASRRRCGIGRWCRSTATAASCSRCRNLPPPCASSCRSCSSSSTTTPTATSSASRRSSFNGHTIASDLTNPDFVKLADSFGARAARVKTPAELTEAITHGPRRRHADGDRGAGRRHEDAVPVHEPAPRARGVSSFRTPPASLVRRRCTR